MNNIYKKMIIFHTGTLTLWNMLTPRTTSMRATSCGVETTTAPVNGTLCVTLSTASPVPGGKSFQIYIS